MSSLADRLAALDAMPSSELRALWVKLVASPTPRISPALLRLALAWEIQAAALGGLPRSTRTQLDQLARGLTRTISTQPGMRLVRSWGGKAHVVTIDEAGIIHWDAREWNSLSEVARAITGTRWSGPAFFGLKRKATAA